MPTISSRTPSVDRRRAVRPALEELETLNPPNNMLGLAWDFGFSGLPVDPFVALSASMLRESAPATSIAAPSVALGVGATAEAQQVPTGSAASFDALSNPVPSADASAVDGFRLQSLSLGNGEGPSVTAVPDLIVDPQTLDHQRFETRTFAAGSCSIAEGHVPGPGTFRLMRFTTTYPNIGGADLAIGNPLAHPELFEYDTCHGHYHFKEYADYRLWTTTGYQQWRALRDATPESTLSRDLLNANPDIRNQMVEGAKRGFCIIDVKRFNNDGPRRPVYTSCATNQGISRGWADEYHMSLDGQWINVTGLAPGNYMLEVEVNAEHVFTEGSYANNDSAVPVRIR